MLRLIKQEERWIEPLPGVRLLMAPIDRAAWRAARRASGAALRAAGYTAETETIAPEDNEVAGDELSRILIERGLKAWEGVLDEAGDPLPITPEAVELLLADPKHFDAIDAAYVIPWLLRDAEGNGSAGSPNGTSTAATPAPTIAVSPAPLPAASGAASAPIANTKRERRKARRSGT